MPLTSSEGMYPPRAFKTKQELFLPQNKSIRKVEIDAFTEIHKCVHASVEGSKIVEFYNGKSVFMTGATGFLGKLLLEKLLRTCKGINAIYILIRPRKGQSAQERLDKTFEDPVFSEIKKTVSNYRSKVIPVEGDISKPSLDMSREHRQEIIKEVNVIIHVAATINFNEPIRNAFSTNVLGTKEIMILAQQCENLVSLVHVSTLYSQCTHEDIKEEFYDPPSTEVDFSQLIQNNTEEYLLENQKKILKDFPNTYTYTKCIGENVVKNMAGNIPTSICRPGVVTPTYREPIPCWIDNIYGAMGLSVAIGIGILKVLVIDNEKTVEMIPGDFISNGILAATYETQFNKEGDIRIYNMNSSTQNPITIGQFVDLVTYYGSQVPSSEAIRCMGILRFKNKHLFFIFQLLLHYLPALIIDCFLMLRGKKMRMIKITRKLAVHIDVLTYFLTNEWKIHNENLRNLWKSLSQKDKEIFNFDIDPSNFNWNTFLNPVPLGLRVYLVKDDLSTIPAAKKKQKRLFYYEVALQTVIYFFLSAIVYYIFRSVW